AGIALLSRYPIDGATHARFVDEIARGVHPGASAVRAPARSGAGSGD
ncbi:MAG: hypothetical protein GX430_07920, partial [Treponema sp.]|nr:hypothetical protein [Treponema sp.]